jgi:hypothetical protein
VWFQVREKAQAESPSVYYWLTPEEDGHILCNEQGFPYGQPLRSVSQKLMKEGHCNGNGGWRDKKGVLHAYHPFQLQEMIFNQLPDLTAAVLGVQLTPEQRQALKEAIIEGCRQKRGYDKITEEDEIRQSWKLLKRPVKRRNPWDQNKE